MEPFLKSDIFFFASTLALLIVTGLLLVVFFYVISIARIVFRILTLAEGKLKQFSFKLDSLESLAGDSLLLRTFLKIFHTKKKIRKKEQ